MQYQDNFHQKIHKCEFESDATEVSCMVWFDHSLINSEYVNWKKQ